MHVCVRHVYVCVYRSTRAVVGYITSEEKIYPCKQTRPTNEGLL